MDQTLDSGSKPGPSTKTAINLDLPHPRPQTTSYVEEMEVDYGPALPRHLRSDPQYALDQHSNPSEEPSKKVSDRPKKHTHSYKKHNVVEPRSASNQYCDESDEPRISSSNSQKNMLTRVNI